MALTIIENACVFDGFHDELSEGQSIRFIFQILWSVPKFQVKLVLSLLHI
jgi:hypothetical protein